ncbi:hypothetical protein CF328_g3052 [Tilletia controversa]|nr:hypothetical protein CF328_g3052 [Tilletia controversa]
MKTILLSILITSVATSVMGVMNCPEGVTPTQTASAVMTATFTATETFNAAARNSMLKTSARRRAPAEGTNRNTPSSDPPRKTPCKATPDYAPRTTICEEATCASSSSYSVNAALFRPPKL